MKLPSDVGQLTSLALEYYRQNKFKKAFVCYEKDLTISPGDPELHNSLGVLCKITGRYELEENYYANALKNNPFHPGANYNLASLCRDQGRMEEAVSFFRRCVGAEPHNVVALNNLATLYLEQKQYDPALKYFNQALRCEPNYQAALVNKGLLFFELGDFDRAIKIYNKAIELDPHNHKACLYYAEVIFYARGVTSCLAVLDNFISKNTLDLEHKIDAMVSLAICQWMLGDMVTFEKTMRFLGKRIFAVKYKNNKDNILRRQAYYVFLEALREDKQDMVRFRKDGKQFLDVVGDSHCLSAARGLIKYNGDEYIGRSHLIMGIKAWHLAVSGRNKYKQAFEIIIEKISEELPVLFAIGEIDCRSTEGIFYHQQKNGGSLRALIRKTVDGYLDFVLRCCGSKKIIPVFQGVPAPDRIKFRTLTPGSVPSYLKMVKEFNDYLALQVKERGCPFVNVFKATVNNELCSNDKYHLDKLHLKPMFYATAFADFME